MIQTSRNYHYQSKICGNPFPRLNCLEPPAQTRSNVDHRFSWKYEKLHSNNNTTIFLFITFFFNNTFLRNRRKKEKKANDWVQKIM